MSEWKTDPVKGIRYKYEKLNNNRASMTTYEDGAIWMRQIHPYDLATYYVAYSQNGKNWGIKLDDFSYHRKPGWFETMTGTAEQVALRLAELDRTVKSRIDHS